MKALLVGAIIAIAAIWTSATGAVATSAGFVLAEDHATHLPGPNCYQVGYDLLVTYAVRIRCDERERWATDAPGSN